MSIYTIVLFLHVSGAIGYFISIGTWLFGLATLRRAQRVEQVRSIANLVGLILMAPLDTALVEPRRRAIDRLAREAPDGPLPESLEQRPHDPLLSTALQTLVALLLGIVFLMTPKPSLPGSLIIIAVALALGLASGLLISRAARTQVQRMDASTGGTRGGAVG